VDEFAIPVPGGVLRLFHNGVELDGLGKYWVEYQGVISRHIALELARTIPEGPQTLLVNNKPVVEFLEDVLPASSSAQPQDDPGLEGLGREIAQLAQHLGESRQIIMRLLGHNDPDAGEAAVTFLKRTNPE